MIIKVLPGVCCSRCDREIGPYETAWKDYPYIICEDCVTNEETNYCVHGHIEELI
jgi:predicted amidophosphoribosyltransferase